MDYSWRRKTESTSLAEVEVTFLGFIKAKWVADREQQNAAWEMYVELVTRIAMQRLPDDQGLLREALTSLYSLFGETRRILKQHGPGVARELNRDAITFAHLAVAVLNVVLRPFLSKWHPALEEYEAKRETTASQVAHERTWEHNQQLRTELEEVRVKLNAYADLLAAAAGIDALHEAGRKG
jgi:predicted ATP-binding protein involved in virulence